MQKFISEDDFDTLEGWLRSQFDIDAVTISPDQLESWREVYDKVRDRSLAIPKVGRMKLKPLEPDELRYAVAIRKDADLWLTLWVRRSPKGDFYVMIPRGDRDWNPHTTYHRDGTRHAKSHGLKLGAPQKRQPLTSAFKGTENLGAYKGHGTSVGAVCHSADFSGVVDVPPGVLGPRNGVVVVDLVDRPGCEPLCWPFKEIARREFHDRFPGVVIRVGLDLP